VKESVFPFKRFHGQDILLSPEMRSTGEVMGLDADLGVAYAKSQMAANSPLPLGGKVFISVSDLQQKHVAEVAKQFAGLGFELVATKRHGGDFGKGRLEGSARDEAARGPAKHRGPAPRTRKSSS